MAETLTKTGKQATTGKSVANSHVQKKTNPAKHLSNENIPQVQASFFSSREREEPQAKLSIGSPNDKFEKEADAMADKVVSQNTVMPKINPKTENIQPRAINPFGNQNENTVQKNKDHEVTEETKEDEVRTKINSTEAKVHTSADRHVVHRVEEDEVQTKTEDTGIQEDDTILTKLDGNSARAPPGLLQMLQTNRGRAPPMDPVTMQFMSGRFGADFSNVSIHTGPEAQNMASSLGAKAFAFGSDIYFAKNKYRPDTTEGQWLLAHELTHTIQQGAVLQERYAQTKPQIHTCPCEQETVSETQTETIQRDLEEDAAFAEEIESFELSEQDDIDITELETPSEELGEDLVPMPGQEEGNNVEIPENGTIERGNGEDGTQESSCPDFVTPIVEAAGQNQIPVSEEIEDEVFGPTWDYLPDGAKEAIIDRMIDAAITLLQTRGARSLLGRYGPVILIAFLRRLRNFATDEKIRIVEKVGSIILGRNRGFAWGLVKGLVIGFFVEGLLGIIQMIIDIICLIPKLLNFIDIIGQFLGQVPEKVVALYQNVQELKEAINEAIEGAEEELMQFIQEPERIHMLLAQMEEYAERQAERIGEQGANFLLAHIDTPAERLGYGIGRVIGMILWEIVQAVVLALLTAYFAGSGGGGSVILSGVKTVVRYIAKAIGKIGRVIIPIIRFIASKLRILIRFIGSVLEFLTTRIRRAARKLQELFRKIRELFDEFVDFIRRRRRRRRRRRDDDDDDDDSPEARIFRAYITQVNTSLNPYRTSGITRDDFDRILHQHRRPSHVRRVVRSIDIADISRRRWRAYAYTTLPASRRRITTVRRIPTGDLSDPIPFRWYKPLSTYPAIISLTDPRDSTNTFPVPMLSPQWIWVPPSRRQNLSNKAETRQGPDGLEVRIGVQPRFVPRVAPTKKRVKKQLAGSVTRRAQSAFRGLLTEYGHSFAGQEADHVIDLGFTGHIVPSQAADHYDNMWPLSESVNQGANSRNASQRVTFNDGTQHTNVALNSSPAVRGKWLEMVQILHPKLKDNQPDNKFEREADRMADHITSSTNNNIQKKCKSCEEEGKKEKIATKLSNNMAGNQAAIPDSFAKNMSASSGATMGNHIRQYMESGFGTSFSNVRVHENETSYTLNNQIGARAFTHGNDIFFGKNEFNPSSDKGKHLLAHELTHVVQQNGVSNKIQRQEVCEASPGSLNQQSSPPSFENYYDDEYGVCYGPQEDEHAGPVQDEPVKIDKADLYKSIPVFSMAIVKPKRGIRLHTTPSPSDPDYVNKRGRAQNKYVQSWFSVVTIIGLGVNPHYGWAKIRVKNDMIGWIELRHLYPGSTLPSFEEQFKQRTKPEPGPLDHITRKLHYVRKGETLEGLIKKNYTDYKYKTGNDRRTIAHAFYIMNESGKGVSLRGSYDDSFWKDTVFDRDFAESRKIYSTIQLNYGYWVRLPTIAYINLQRELENVGVRPDWKNTAIAVGRGIQGFYEGVHIGFAKAAVDMVVDIWKLIKGIFTGEIFKKGYELVKQFIELYEREGIAGIWRVIAGFFKGIYKSFKERWETPNPRQRWRFVGEIVGMILFEIALALLTAGAATAAKWSAKLAKVLNKFPALDNIVKTGAKKLDNIKDMNGRRVKKAKSLRDQKRLGLDDDKWAKFASGKNKTWDDLKADPELLKLEMDALNKSKARPSTVDGYDIEIEIPNGHTYRRQKPPKKGWCRFSKKSGCGEIPVDDYINSNNLKQIRELEDMHDDDAFDMHDYLETHQNTKNPPGSKKPRDKTTLGTFVHSKVYKKFVDWLDSAAGEAWLKKKNISKADLALDLPKGKIGHEFPVQVPGYSVGYKPRIDVVDWDKAIVHEIKPSHLSKRGYAESQWYAEMMNKYHPRADGKKWKAGNTITYDAQKVYDVFKKFGYFD